MITSAVDPDCACCPLQSGTNEPNDDLHLCAAAVRHVWDLKRESSCLSLFGSSARAVAETE